MKNSLFVGLFFVIIAQISFPCTYAQIPKTQSEITLSFAPLVKKTIPSVVNIYAARQIRARSPFEGDPFFEQFFGRFQNNLPVRKQSSLGSGVIVDTRGLIVTNYHVIKDANEIKVALSDGREFESKVMLKDEATDIAVLKIDAKGAQFPVLPLGDSDAVEVGDLVLAIGNPFGVGQTVTSGIVSAQARTRVGISDFDFFIQTDAAINPGNSGGALIDMKGQLIGINTAIYSRSGGSVGIGFAIPANLVKVMLDTVKHGGKYFVPPYIGASFQNVTPDIAGGLGLERPYGALIIEISKDSPAEKAGLKVGDVILSMQGVRIDSPDSLGYRLMTAGMGQSLPLEYLRNGKTFKTEITVLSVPESEFLKSEKIIDEGPLSGAEVLDLTPQNSRRFHLPVSARGVVITNLDELSNAAGIFRPGDILRVVNGHKIQTVSQLKKILMQSRPRIWQLEYERDGMYIRQFIR
ncbi:DegQ family serine endoprotease [Bartonella taylorii]|uniref:DegQ family serine endoprotease n=2 Tax=Bartonella taylorii TaxID=33046 RepID=A0A9Q8YYY5_BARTA|nr:DegQ family serine endoprotease [Bartonella taylorii]EJF96069.1 protease Do [Bartonella taylorii 8TBB]OPB35259.1 Do/DeqQ family serine protease [Bartonella taylorii]USP01660.1 DegQ family serine endoprotease [Bartonella taylorii]USP03262.1 DegQ family serine endoprotease [Bartonella taylorii]